MADDSDWQLPSALGTLGIARFVHRECEPAFKRAIASSGKVIEAGRSKAWSPNELIGKFPDINRCDQCGKQFEVSDSGYVAHWVTTGAELRRIASMRDLDSIPWNRIVHFHGRASNIPAAIHALDSDDRKRRSAAIQNLRDSLEHQDTVIQATAVAVPFLVTRLESFEDSSDLLDLLTVLFDAAAFQLANNSAPTPPPRLEDLLAEEKQWPPFDSEEEDEILWEDSGVTDDLPAWAWFTANEISSAREIVERLALRDSTRESATKLLGKIDAAADVPTPRPQESRKPWWKIW